MVRSLAATLLLIPMLAHAEVSELRITKQPGISYLAPIVMEQRHLIETEAAKLGVPALQVSWVTFGSGGAATDALLAGDIHVVTSGASNLLLLWDRAHGAVKGLASASALPVWLVTNRPELKTLRDLQSSDRIALPT